MSKIAVYADWEGLHGPQRLGFLHSRRTRASELFDTAARALRGGRFIRWCQTGGDADRTYPWAPRTEYS